MDTMNMPDMSFKRFLGSTLLFLLILGMIRIFIGWFIPYHTGSWVVSEKVRYIEENKKKVDVIFLGSSRIRRGIIPTLFDSLTHRYSQRAGISFNMGGPAAYIAENLYLLRKYAASDAGDHLKTVVIEWTGAYLPSPDKYKTERGRYWMDMQSLTEQLSLMRGAPGLINAWKEGKIQYVFGAFLHRNLGLRRVSNNWMNTIKPDPSNEDTRGYNGLYRSHAPLVSKKPPKPGIPGFDPRQAQRDALNARNIHAMEHLEALSEDVELWQGLINSHTQRGIRLVLLIPPGPVNERQLALLRRLPKDHFIDLSDPLKFPALYNSDLFFDYVHLNHDGARLLTQYLAESFLKLEGVKQDR
jgi:hypothetical protein